MTPLDLLNLLSTEPHLVSLAERCCMYVVKNNAEQLVENHTSAVVDNGNFLHELSERVHEFHRAATRKFHDIELLNKLISDVESYYTEVICPLGHVHHKR